MTAPLRGVIAAIATPIGADHRPDAARFLKLGQHLAKLGAVGLRPARRLAEHLLASGAGKLGNLCRHALTVR